MAGFYMIGDIELKIVDNKIESFNKDIRYKANPDPDLDPDLQKKRTPDL